MRPLTGMALGALVLCALPGTARAQGLAEMDDEPEAHVAFRAGQAAFHRGQYQAAMDSFREAYRLDPRPELLYDIGESAYRAGLLRDSLDAFESYLENVSEVHPRRAAVRRKVAELRERIAAGERDAARGPGAAPWIIAGAGMALVVAGAVMLGVGISEQESVGSGGGSDALVGVGVAFLSVGALALAGGLYWGITSGADDQPRVTAILSPLGAGLFGNF